jgi:2-oxoglutarate dehydrogenase E2 component (dihydrolipoamide succinyltransferase)
MRHEIKVPSVGESIQEVQIGKWLKREGESVGADDNLVEIESDKATVDLPSPLAGVIAEIVHNTGDTVAVGAVIAYVDDAPQGASAESAPATPAVPAAAKATTEAPAPPAPAPTPASAAPPAASAPSTAPSAPAPSPPAPPASAAPSPVVRPVPPPPPQPEAAPARPPQAVPSEKAGGSQLVRSDGKSSGQISALHGAPPRSEEIVPMSRIRKMIADRLVEVKNTTASLTTCKEVDMSAVINMRQQYRESFQERYNTKLGFMSFFVKAVVESLKACPELNAEIRDGNIVYRNYYDISIAVGGGKGLVVPVIRNAELLNFSEIEQTIADFGARAKSGQLKPDELTGGTFTITNGGVYGSTLSTPILNPPQSGILGLHGIEEKPVVRDHQIVIRPMMWIALTYDHRLVDGREAVGFAVRVKEYIEDPTRLLLQL